MNHVLITGANRGIGLALTAAYAQRGDIVFACCRSPDAAIELHALSQQRTVTILSLDVSNADSVSALANAVSATPVDILINNAGIIGQPRESQTAANIDFELWEEILRTNTMGPARVLKALLPHLQRSREPKVMNITSDLGALSHDDPIYYGYSASKAALNKFMRLAAIELRTRGIAIGLVHPGWVQTDMGGAQAPVTPTNSAQGIIGVIDRLNLKNTGSFWQWDGTEHAW